MKMPPCKTTCRNVICQWVVFCICYEQVVCPTANLPFCASIVQFVVDKVQCYREPNARQVRKCKYSLERYVPPNRAEDAYGRVVIFRCKTRAGQYYYEFYEAIEDNTLQNNRYRFRQLPDAFRLDEIIVVHQQDNVVKIRRRYDNPHRWTFTLVFDNSSPGQAEQFTRSCLFRVDGVLQPQESIESNSSNTTTTTEESTSTGIERQSSADFDLLVENM